MEGRPPPRILAIDAATQTGAAIGVPGETPVCSTANFSHDDHLEVCARAIQWISKTLTGEPFDCVYIEKPMPMGATKHGRSSAAAISRLWTLYGIFGGAAKLAGLRVVAVKVQDARVNFLGHPNLERKEAKRRAVAMCRLLGWSVRNDDEADAACLWSYAAACEAPRLAPIIHPGLHAKAATLAYGEGVRGALL